MIREADIVYENGSFWVLRDRQAGGAYVVLRAGLTHAVSDSAYALDDDGLSIAKARCDYLAKRAAP